MTARNVDDAFVELLENARSAKRRRADQLIESGAMNGISYIQRNNYSDNIRKLIKTLDKCGMVRTLIQRDVHTRMIEACLPKILEGAQEEVKSQVCKEFELDPQRTSQLLMTMLPRRSGKTVSVQIFAAAYMLAVPDSEILIFSTGRRASEMLMKGMLKYLATAVGDEATLRSMTRQKNQEVLELNVDGTPRILRSLPGGSAT